MINPRLILSILILIFNAVLFAQNGGVFQPGYFYTSNSSKYDNKKVIKGYPEIHYQFKELKDTTLYNASVKEITVYQKYNKPFIKDDKFLFVNPSLQFDKIDMLVRKYNLNIEALKFYIDTTTFNFSRDKSFASIQTYLPYKCLYAPFYILKTEVTNKEYREFITYVKDSLARMLLSEGSSNLADKFCYHDSIGKRYLKWNTPIPWNSNDTDVRADLTPLYISAAERFYNRPEIDTRKLNYEYNYYPNGAEDYIKHVVNIYPDTLCWVHDFFFSGILNNDLEALLNMYQWHPAYDDYPVVGLSFPLVKAFLHWKTERMQKELDKKGVKFIIECDLPSELEWETVNCANSNGNSIQYYNTFSSYDKNMLSDLYYKCNSPIEIDSGKLGASITKTSSVFFGYNNSVFLKDSTIETEMFDYVRLVPSIEQERLNEYVQRNRRFTTKSLITPCKNKKGFNENNTRNGLIYFAHNNVSEWMREVYFETDTNYESYKFYKKKSLNFLGNDNEIEQFPYDGNYKYILNLYLKMLKQYNSPYIREYEKRIEETVKNYTNKSFRLVRGANWYDTGSLYNGDEKKTFVAGDSAHSTLGFRYVIRFKEKK